MSLPERFWSKVRKTETCWWWVAGASGGYGKFQLEGRKQYAHRLAYAERNGLIPAGLTVDHLCRNTLCVNPAHLEAVTVGENTARGYAVPTRVAMRRRNPCRNGHPRSPENVYTDNAGKIHCRPCNAENQRRYAQRKRASA